jgi:hypothetical protein
MSNRENIMISLLEQKNSINKLKKILNPLYKNDDKAKIRFIRILRNFLRGKQQLENKNELELLLKNLEPLKNKFPSIFKPEKNIIYRGTLVSKKLINKTGYSKLPGNWPGGDRYITKSKIIYNPKSNIQSWSSNIESARDFTLFGEFGKAPTYKKGYVNAILKTKAQPNELWFS